jgi:hypothetical protein
MADESKKPVSARAVAQLRRFLKRNEWKYVLDGAGTLRGLSGGNGTNWHWLARASSNGGFLMFYAYCPAAVPDAKRAAAAEYLTRCNWGLTFGTFEMDWSDGQVCFRTSVPLGPAGTSKPALEHLVWGNGLVMQRYLPGLFAVALGDALPEEACREAEAEPTQETVTNDASTSPPSPGHARRFSASDN